MRQEFEITVYGRPVHPSSLRSGTWSGAFILWVEDELGRRRCPVIYKPVDALAAVAPVEAAA